MFIEYVVNTKYYNIFNLYKYSLYKFLNVVWGKNLISIKYLLIKYMLSLLSLPLLYPHISTINLITPYYYPVKAVITPFYKTKLNTLVYVNMYTLLSFYLTYFNLHKLKTSITTLNTNFDLLPMLNLFYFKIRNY
jgi:hypothetical protein